jgi:hypothetical protein
MSTTGKTNPAASSQVREPRLRVPAQVFTELCRIAEGAGARPETFLEAWVADLSKHDPPPSLSAGGTGPEQRPGIYL